MCIILPVPLYFITAYLLNLSPIHLFRSPAISIICLHASFSSTFLSRLTLIVCVLFPIMRTPPPPFHCNFNSLPHPTWCLFITQRRATLPWWRQCVQTVWRSRDWGRRNRRTHAAGSCHGVSCQRDYSTRTRWGRARWDVAWRKSPPTWTSGEAT